MDKLRPLAALGTMSNGQGLAGCSLPSPSRNTSVSASGRVISVNGPIILGYLPRAAIGDQCVIELRDGRKLFAQVVGFDSELIRIAPLSSTKGLSVGCAIRSDYGPPQLKIKDSVKGCVLDCLGNVTWRSEFARTSSESEWIARALEQEPPGAMSRQRIVEQFVTGVRTIDGLCTLGRGQRVGLFAPPGVGKSTLLSMIARNAEFDTCVIGLVGERGREVKEFIEDALGSRAMKRSVVVLATSDESPMRRRQAALTATSIAEHYRDKGENVLLLIDSLTRMARASREIGLAAGELPVRKGFTSSVFTELPQLLERAGNSDRGSITAVYTVLTEGQEIDDPLAEEVKSILDGHLVLSPDFASRGIYPAIDPVSSVSRLMNQVLSPLQLAAAQRIRALFSRLERDRDLILFGGSPDAELQVCLNMEERLWSILRQAPTHAIAVDDTDLTIEAFLYDFNSRLEKVKLSS